MLAWSFYPLTNWTQHRSVSQPEETPVAWIQRETSTAVLKLSVALLYKACHTHSVTLWLWNVETSLNISNVSLIESRHLNDSPEHSSSPLEDKSRTSLEQQGDGAGWACWNQEWPGKKKKEKRKCQSSNSESLGWVSHVILIKLVDTWREGEIEKIRKQEKWLLTSEGLIDVFATELPGDWAWCYLFLWLPLWVTIFWEYWFQTLRSKKAALAMKGLVKLGTCLQRGMRPWQNEFHFLPLLISYCVQCIYVYLFNLCSISEGKGDLTDTPSPFVHSKSTDIHKNFGMFYLKSQQHNPSLKEVSLKKKKKNTN